MSKQTERIVGFLATGLSVLVVGTLLKGGLSHVNMDYNGTQDNTDDAIFTARYPDKDEELCVHYGSCHCERIRFQIKAPRQLKAVDITSKIRFPRVSVARENFEFLSDFSDVSLYSVQNGPGSGIGVCTFCSCCGVHVLFSPAVVVPSHIQVNMECLQESSRAGSQVTCLYMEESQPLDCDGSFCHPQTGDPLPDRRGRGFHTAQPTSVYEAILAFMSRNCISLLDVNFFSERQQEFLFGTAKKGRAANRESPGGRAVKTPPGSSPGEDCEDGCTTGPSSSEGSPVSVTDCASTSRSGDPNHFLRSLSTPARVSPASATTSAVSTGGLRAASVHVEGFPTAGPMQTPVPNEATPISQLQAQTAFAHTQSRSQGRAEPSSVQQSYAQTLASSFSPLSLRAGRGEQNHGQTQGNFPRYQYQAKQTPRTPLMVRQLKQNLQHYLPADHYQKSSGASGSGSDQYTHNYGYGHSGPTGLFQDVGEPGKDAEDAWSPTVGMQVSTPEKVMVGADLERVSTDDTNDDNSPVFPHLAQI